MKKIIFSFLGTSRGIVFFLVFLFGFFLFVPSAQAALVGHYTFDSTDMDWGAGSGQIHDVSGSGNHGTAYNLSVGNEVAGQISGALQFNGSNTYIRIPSAASFPPSGNAPRTVCMWFKPTLSSWTPNQAIFGYGSASGLNSFGIDMDIFPQIQFYTYGYDLMVDMGISGHEEDWLQICWVWDGVNTSLLYSNGVLRGSQAFGAINTTQTDVYIGTSIAGDGFFPGIIDDVRIYDTAFTDEDIQELYGAGAINITNIAADPGETTATITWDTTAAADSTVWYGTSPGVYTDSVSAASLVINHSLGLTGLTPETTYYFIVVSEDDSENSATSSEQTFTTLALTPSPSPTPTPTSTTNNGGSNSGSSSGGSSSSCSASAPTAAPDLFQIDAASTTATLYFTPVSNADRYYISYGTDSSTLGHGVEIKTGQATGVITHTIADLTPGETYYFRVRAGKDCAPGEWGNTRSSRLVAGIPNTGLPKDTMWTYIVSLIAGIGLLGLSAALHRKRI